MELLIGALEKCNWEWRKWMNHEQTWTHTIQYFRCVTYHMCIFIMESADVCKYNHTPFLSRPVIYTKHASNCTKIFK